MLVECDSSPANNPNEMCAMPKSDLEGEKNATRSAAIPDVTLKMTPEGEKTLHEVPHI